MVEKVKNSIFANRSEILVLVLVWAFALVLFAILFTYSANDPGWNNGNILPDQSKPNNIGGIVGAHIADMGIYVFGYFALFIPLCIAQFGWNYTRKWTKKGDNQILLSILFFIGIIMAMIGGCGLEYLYFSASSPDYYSGGILGYEITRTIFTYTGPNWNLVALIFIGLLVLGTSAVGIVSWDRVLDITGRLFLGTCKILFVPKSIRTDKTMKEEVDPKKYEEQEVVPEQKPERKRKPLSFKKVATDSPIKEKKSRHKAEPPSTREQRRVEPKIVPIDDVGIAESKQTKIPTFAEQKSADTEPPSPDAEPSSTEPEVSTQAKKPPQKVRQPAFPKTSLLDPSNKYSNAYSEEEINQMGSKIESMLKDFNVEVEVRKAHPGPVITQFEVEPAAGTKASQIVSLSNDLARTLTVQSVRVVDNIPGSPYIGIEVPNRKREMVRLIDGLESKDYKNSDHPLTIILGKDIRGDTVLSNLASMPHLLIAGTTGAGKSVCLNAILLSFLFKSTPSSLKLIMVDPKMLEFSVYEGIPHLLTPVITDMNKTENALRWCISEMERRFRLMAELGVRNLEKLNDTIRTSADPIPDPMATDSESAVALEPVPYIVFVIDELSDLIMVMGKKAEELIIRIAQRARAAGIHLIVATQRPSTDVIRGVLKANIPTRIGFKVASNADSRTILDQTGAENLLGSGDMLFLPPGSASLMRVHGAFVSDDEVKRVVDSVKHASKPDYDPSVVAAVSSDDGAGSFDGASVTQGEDDELYNKAVDFVIRSRRPTISSVQRFLRIGYNRAARLIETMEEAGVISPVQAGGKREVLVPPPED